MNLKSISASALCLCFAMSWTASIANADVLVADFTIKATFSGPTEVDVTVPSFATVTFTLNGNGTISANLQASQSFLSFAFESTSHEVSSGFSASSYSDTSSTMSPFGQFNSGFTFSGGPVLRSQLSWTIGTPGEFTSVYDALGGSTASHEFYLLSGGPGGITGTSYASDVSAAVPEPSTWAMMILGFAGVGFMAYRRSCKDQGLALAAA